ncbi:MAG TPA: zeta toxin family protein [Bacteroidales bacterium]|nr:zeta toxin family protein [Bacteroidales bacterium]
MNISQFNSHILSPTGKLPARSFIEPLLVLLNIASTETLREYEYCIDYSVPGGVYGHFKGYTPSDADLKKIQEKIRQLVRENERLFQELLPAEKIQRHFMVHQRPDIIHLIRSRGKEISKLDGFRLVRLNGGSELFMNRVQENLNNLENFKLFKAKKGFFLIANVEFFERAMPDRIETSKYLRRIEESQDAMAHLGISNVAHLNDVINRGELSEFLKIAEAYQTKSISRIADNIVSHPLKPKVIFLAGPTSSGKTTSANRLALELKVLRKNVIILSLDNYYLPHSAIPNDPETGLKNFELISALDLELFRQNIDNLLAGKPVFLPKYFFDGKGATISSDAITIDNDTYIIVEGIHGLNPSLWRDAIKIESYRLYVSALTTLNIHDHLPFSTSDHRLIRRLVRDHLFRGYDFNETIKRWPDVVNNEYQSIFPYQESAHAIFNSALIYEMAVFAHYAPALLNEVNAENELIAEEVTRLNRLLSLFKSINPSEIPPTSILREFIGGSSFKY